MRVVGRVWKEIGVLLHGSGKSERRGGNGIRRTRRKERR